MKEELKKFLSTLGLPSEFISAMEAEEFPEDFNLQETISTWENGQKSVWLKKLDSDINKIFDTKFATKEIKLAKSVAKAVGLEKSDREIKELGFDGLVKLVDPHIQSRVTGAAEHTDETLRTELETWKTQATDWKGKFEAYKTTSEQEIDKVRKEVELEKHMNKVNSLFADEFSKIDYGITTEQIPLFENAVKKQILENYRINTEDRTITDLDGGQAVNFDKNAVYTHLAEPIATLANQYNVIKRSNGGGGSGGSGGSGGGPAGGTLVVEDLSPEAKSLYERAKKARS